MVNRRVGDQWVEGDLKFTVNPANDKDISDPNAYYVSVMDMTTKQHATAVYLPDGTLADVKSNDGWKPVRTQKQGLNWGKIFRDAWERNKRIWFK